MRGAAMAVIASAVLPMVAGAQRPALQAAPLTWARVTYLSGPSVYLEVGTNDGVVVGTAMDVVRHGTVVAVLAAKYVASNRTACTITRSDSTVVVGDSVRFVPARTAPATIAGATATRSTRHRAPVRGRVGVQYLALRDAGGSSLTQPAFDLRLDGSHIGGTAVGLAVDVRAQRNTVSGAMAGTAPAGLTRVYQAALILEPLSARSTWTLGRQFASALSPVGIFDGMALDIHGRAWSEGILAGTQPDAATVAPSLGTTEYGLYVQRHNVAGTSAPWNATLGAVGSYDQGAINREYLYARGVYGSRRWSLYAAEEVDVNRGWRRGVEGSLMTLTSTFATAQWSVTDAFQLSGGFDSRRSVRLYRDFVNPETVFDDAMRQGTWAGFSWRLGSHLRISADGRNSFGGSDGNTQSATGGLALERITVLRLALRLRATQYRGPASQGSLSSATLEMAPTPFLRISANGGVRSSAAAGVAATRLTWTGADVDWAIGRSLFLTASTYRERGGPTATTQTYAGLSWRF